METLSQQEIEFLDYKGEPTKSKTMNYINQGYSFYHSIIKVLSENLINHYEYIRNNVRDEDKHIFSEWDNNIELTYQGEDLSRYEKEIFDTLPNIGKWQISNYSRVWRALEEAGECLTEFVYHELNYLC